MLVGIYYIQFLIPNFVNPVYIKKPQFSFQEKLLNNVTFLLLKRLYLFLKPQVCNMIKPCYVLPSLQLLLTGDLIF